MTHTRRVSAQALGLLLAWLALWAVVVTTWLYDSNGYTVGMPGPVFLLMMFGPLLVGLALGWGKASHRLGMKAGMLGGVAYGLANMVAQLVWGLVLRALGLIPPDAMAEMGGPEFFVIEVVEFTVLFTATGLVLGLVGALLGATVFKLSRH